VKAAQDSHIVFICYLNVYTVFKVFLLTFIFIFSISLYRVLLRFFGEDSFFSNVLEAQLRFVYCLHCKLVA